MQAKVEKTKGDLIVELRGKTAPGSRTIKEIGPNGVKMEVNDEGQATGKYNARHMETTTVWIKPDGTMEWDSKGIESTSEGDFIAITGKGKGRNTGPTTAAWEGEITFMTQSKRLAWLNNTRGWVEGTGNNATDVWEGRVYTRK